MAHHRGSPARHHAIGRRRFRRTALATAVGIGLALTGCSAAGDWGGSRAADGTPASTPLSTTASTTAGACVSEQDLAARFGRLEAERDVRVGVHLLDTGTGVELSHRGGERFAFASTIKALAAAVVLDRLSTRELGRRLRWTEDELVPYSPVTEQHVADGLTVREVLDAAVTVSDNTAANLLLDVLGGPQVLDRALDEVGDTTTLVVRREPELNDYAPDDTRDTTTPRALAESLAAFAIGGELAAADERALRSLLWRNTTGDDLVRAVVPDGWRVGDKTGTASYGTRNDVAVLTPPGREPLVLAVMTRHADPDAEPDDTAVAEAARIALEGLCLGG